MRNKKEANLRRKEECPEEIKLLQNDIGGLIDYKKFWTFVDQKYFGIKLLKSIPNAFLLIDHLATYGKFILFLLLSLLLLLYSLFFYL